MEKKFLIKKKEKEKDSILFFSSFVSLLTSTKLVEKYILIINKVEKIGLTHS